jgi:CHAD domain-containing protein
MITRKKQQDYIHARWENIVLNFYKFAKRINVQSIHDIRVDLKKLRALIFLQEQAGNKISRKEKALLKRLFQQAGKIREAQVASQLIRSAKVKAPEFLLAQKRHVKEESGAFISLFRKSTDEVVKLNTRLWKDVVPVRGKVVKNTQKRLISAVKKSYNPKLKENELHASRKLIKRYVYISSLLKKQARQKDKQVILQLKKLEDLVGKWHDAIVTAGLIRWIPGAKNKLAKVNAIAAQRLKLVENSGLRLFGIRPV